MKKVYDIVEENRVEAINIVKANGGRIDFVDNIIKNNPDNHEEDDWNGTIEDLENLDFPMCLINNVFADTIFVLSVIIEKDDANNECLKFLAVSEETEQVIGWVYDFACYWSTENNVYEYIENYKKD